MSPVQSLVRRDAEWRLRNTASASSGSGSLDRSTLVYGTYEPSTATAGVLPGTTLIPYTPPGDRVWRIPTENAVISNYEVFGRVKPEAKNIVFENCYVHGLPENMLVNGNQQPLAECVSSLTNGGPTIFRDCTFIADHVTGGVEGIKGGNFIAERCVIANTIDGFHVYDRTSVIKGCYVPYLHWIPDDPAHGPEGSHNDAVQFQGGALAPYLTVKGNSFNIGYSPYGTSNIGFLVTNNRGNPSGWAIEDNYFRNKLNGNRIGIPLNISINTVTNFTVRGNKIELGRDDYHIIARTAIRNQVIAEPGNVDLDTGQAIIVQPGG